LVEARQPLAGEESVQVHLLVGARAVPLAGDQGLVIQFALPGEHMAKERTDLGASAAEQAGHRGLQGVVDLQAQKVEVPWGALDREPAVELMELEHIC
jgi:hypothetical protein